MEILKKGGVTAAKGFLAASTEASIKYKGRKDMAMIFSQIPCKAAGTFTSNIVKAAPVLWDKGLVEKGTPVQAVVINAGIANACTGKEGFQYCEETAEKAASLLGLLPTGVLLGSTGVIGQQLPIESICKGVEKLVDDLNGTLENGTEAAKAIMTTDTISKEAAVSFEINGKTVTIGGMCKGSGMIHPNMCTMLSFVTTDVAISKELLTEAVKTDVADTYNMISVDGDTSTNDTFLVMANGLAGNPEITKKDENYQKFCEALHTVNKVLAQKMAGDGEGATALFETKVIHAATKEDARLLSKSVICSSLTKAAIFGHDANWGRILCSLGYSGADFDPNNLELYFEGKQGKILIYKDGTAVDYSEEEATKILAEPKVTVLVDMKMGEEEACAWGCDLSYEYVKINADYRS
jgi:glutamate N-acetyltransferase/amino-acid N-acetyltransferase